MLSAPLYRSNDLGNGCLGTLELLRGNERVRHLTGSECALRGHLRLTVGRGTVGAYPDIRYR
jgi:hypothetical protein